MESNSDISSRLQPRDWRFVPWLLLAAFVVVIALLFATRTIILSRSMNTPEGRSDLLRQIAKDNVELSQLIASVEGNNVWIATREQLKAIQTQLGAAEAAEKQLQAEFARLETTSAGNRLAADEAAFGCFLALRDHVRVDPVRFRDHRGRYEKYQSLCDTLLKNSTTVVPDNIEVQRAISSIEQDLVQSSAAIEEDRNALQALLASCPQAVPGGPTLASAVQQWRHKQGRFYLARLADEHAFRWNHADDQANELKRKEREAIQAREEFTEKLRIARAMAKSQRAKELAEQALKEIERLDAARSIKQDLSELISDLSRIVDPGRMQLDSQLRWAPRPGKKKPLSWSALETAHVLRPDELGFRNFAALFYTGAQSPNDRSDDLVSPQGMTRDSALRIAHQNLIRFADVLLEEKRLQP